VNSTTSTPAATRTRLPEGRRTPWGRADFVEQITNGQTTVISVCTPSHGGYFVPKKHLDRIDPAHRAYALKWSGSEQWYEEDCAWAAVVLAFPELFDAEHLAAAKESAARWLDAPAISAAPVLPLEARCPRCDTWRTAHVRDATFHCVRCDFDFEVSHD
jgi:hypothetical protein